MGLNTNPYSNTPIKNLEYIQNKALVIAPFEITKSGLIDTDLMLDTPGTITMYFFRKNFNNIDKEPTAEQFKVVGTVNDIITKLGLDITASNISSSITSSYYLGFTKINVIFKYDKNTGIRTIEKDNSLLTNDYTDIGIDSTCDLTTEDYFVICNVTKNTKATNTSFTESGSMDFLFMIPSDECQEIITDFDILDTNNQTINIKKYGTLGSGFVADNDTTIEPAYLADFFGDGSNIATYLFDGTARDLNGNYNGTTTNVTYGDGKVGQAAVFNGTNSLSYSTLPTSLKTYKCLVTISCWARTTNSAGKTLINVGDSSKFIYGMTCSSFGMNLDNSVTSYVSAGISSTITDDIWHHYVGIYDGTTSYFYIDGILKATSSIVNGSNGGNGINGLNIGCLSTNYPASYFNGSIDQVRIFNRALNQNEVTALYLNNASTRVIKRESLINENLVTTGLIGNFKLNNSYKNLVNNLDFYSSSNMIGLTYDESDQSIESLISKSSYLKLNGLYSTNTVATISLWLKWYGGNDSSILRFGSYQIILDSNAGQFGFNTFHNDVYGINLNSYINKWVHLTIEFKTNSFGSIYINGVKQTLSQLRSTPVYSNAIVQGRDLIVLPGNYNGKIKELKMFNRLLTANEVYQNYIGYEITSKPDFFKDGSNIATYLFNGNCNDETGSYNGTATGITYTKGKFGQAAVFNGISDASNIALKSWNGIGDFTISLWVNKDRALAGETIFGRYSSSYGTGGAFFGITTETNGAWGITNEYNTGVYVGVNAGTDIIPLNTWTHLIVTISGSTVSIYTNGKLSGSSTSSNWATGARVRSTSLLYLGQTYIPDSGTTHNMFKGQIDNVRIFNRALNQREVLELYNEQPSYEEQLALNEVMGKTLIPNGNPLIVYDRDIGPSIKFDGSSYYTISSSNDFSFGIDNFTVEGYFYLSSSTSWQKIISITNPESILLGWYDNKLSLDWNNSATSYSSYISGTFNTNTWYHVAVVREGTKISLFIGGNLIGSTTIGSLILNSSIDINIGLAESGWIANFQGSISQLHIIKGIAKYTSNFTPASRLVQTLNTVLLLQVDKPIINTNNWSKIQLESVEAIPTSSIIEQTGKVLTNTGVTIDTTIVSDVNKINSIYFNGASNLSIPASNDFAFGTGNFTIELMVNIKSYPVNQYNYTLLLTNRLAVAGLAGTWGLNINGGSTSGRVSFSEIVVGPTQALFSKTHLALNTWYHLAFVRNNGKLSLYINGVLDITIDHTINYSANTKPLLVGTSTDAGGYFNGYMQDIRITKGVALYSSNFTPKTDLVKDTNTSLLIQSYQINSIIKDPKRKDFFGDKSMIACYMLDSNANDETGMYNGTATNITYTDGKFGKCAVFNGSTSKISSNINLNSNNFSISFWGNLSNIQSTHSFILSTINGDNRYGIRMSNFGKLEPNIWAGVDNAFGVDANWSNYANIWTHYVFSIINNTCYFYINNELKSSKTFTSNVIFNGVNIGYGEGGIYDINGQLDNVKIFNRALTDSEVTSLYNETISPIITLEPETETIASEPDFFNDKSNIATYLFNNYNETDVLNLLGEDFSDVTGKTITNNGVTIDTTNKASGSGSYKFSDNSYISLPTSNDFVFGTGDFTIECDFYLISPSIYGAIILEGRPDGTNGTYITFGLDAAGKFGIYSNNATILTSNTTLVTNKWYHLSCKRRNGIFTLLIDGVLDATSGVTSINFTRNTFVIGKNAFSSMVNTTWVGNIDNIKLSRHTILDANSKYPGTPINITYGTGKFGKCAIFDGNLSLIDIPNTLTSQIKAFSANIKFNTTYLSSSYSWQFSSIICWSNTTLNFGILANGKIRFYWYDGGWKYFDGTTVLTAGVWYNISFSITNNIVYVYLNGSLEVTGTFTNFVLGQFTGLRIGYDNSANKSFDGQIDNVRIFNRPLTQSEVQDLYKETKRVKYKAITLDNTNFGPAAKFNIETQKEIKLLNYKTWTGTDATSQGYRIYPVMKIQDHTSEETSFSPKFYLGAKYQRNLAEVLLPSIKSKRTMWNLKDMYLVDDLCIQTLNKINAQLQTDQMIKFTDRLYRDGIREKINAEVILDYISTPVTGSSNMDINSILKTSLINDYGFTQDEITNLNDNLNTFRSRARMNIGTPTIQGQGLDQVKFSLPKTFADGNRSKTEKKNLLVFGTDAGFNKFSLNGYSAPYSNITKRDASAVLNYSDLSANFVNINNPVSTKTYLCFSGSLTEFTGKTYTSSGLSLSTTTKKYNASSLYINNGLITIPASTLTIGTGDFTIEMQINPSSIASVPILSLGSNGSQCCFITYLNSDGSLMFRSGIGGWGWEFSSDRTTSVKNIVVNTWNYIVIQRRNGILEIYTNGTLAYSGSWSFNIPNGSYIYIGSYVGGGTITAYYDDIRITSGIANYNGMAISAPLIGISDGFKDILTNYKQQIPFSYIPLSTDPANANNEPVFENLTDITGFDHSEIVIDLPNVL